MKRLLIKQVLFKQFVTNFVNILFHANYPQNRRFVWYRFNRQFQSKPSGDESCRIPATTFLPITTLAGH